MTFNHPPLPTEVWTRVLSNLSDFRDLGRAECVSHGFQNILRKMVWPRIDRLHIKINEDDECGFELFLNNVYFSAEGDPEYTRVNTQYIVDRLTGLKSIRISGNKKEAEYHSRESIYQTFGHIFKEFNFNLTIENIYIETKMAPYDILMIQCSRSLRKITFRPGLVEKFSTASTFWRAVASCHSLESLDYWAKKDSQTDRTRIMTGLKGKLHLKHLFLGYHFEHLQKDDLVAALSRKNFKGRLQTIRIPCLDAYSETFFDSWVLEAASSNGLSNIDSIDFPNYFNVEPSKLFEMFPRVYRFYISAARNFDFCAQIVNAFFSKNSQKKDGEKTIKIYCQPYIESLQKETRLFERERLEILSGMVRATFRVKNQQVQRNPRPEFVMPALFEPLQQNQNLYDVVRQISTVCIHRKAPMSSSIPRSWKLCYDIKKGNARVRFHTGYYA